MSLLKFRDLTTLKKMVDACEAAKDPRGIALAHDHGVYLCTTHLRHPDDGTGFPPCVCVYADGCDPKKDADFYETARRLVGGDDFGEVLDVKHLVAPPGAEALLVRFGATSFALQWLLGKPTTKAGKAEAAAKRAAEKEARDFASGKKFKDALKKMKAAHRAEAGS